MGDMIALVGTLGLVLGLITLIKPISIFGVPTRKRALAVIVGSIVVGSIGVRLAEQQATVDTASTNAPGQLGSASATRLPVPPDQAAFIKAVADSRAAFRKASNDMAKGGVRAERRQAICSALESLAAQGWIGRITELSSNSDGKGVLSIAVADHVTLTTWNNAVSDLADETLLEPGSPVFTAAASMKRGDTVMVSGEFVASDVDCVGEQSVTLEGSITEPEFTFRFRSVQRP